MLRVALVNMPFAAWNRPSFALSQLSALIQRDFRDEVSVDVHYLNVDFAEYLGAATYESISELLDHLHTGVGDWLFRDLAFPDAPDNTEEYFRRFYRGDRWAEFRNLILECRTSLPDVCADLITKHRLDEADIVGFTSMFAQNGPSIALATMIKQRNPGVVTIMGGANCEAPMGGVLAARVPSLDYVFSGPALDTFATFLRYRIDSSLSEVDSVRGILSRRNCTDPRYRDAIGTGHDIDDFFPPDYSAFLTALADHPTLEATSAAEPTLFFETSRGCWWGQRSHCTFCGLNGQSMNYRSMAAPTALEQFNWLFTFAPTCAAFHCTDNVMPRNYTRDVFPHLTPPPGAYIYYEVKLPLSRQDMATMAKAGVTTVQPGIEALATSTLRLMGKGTTVFQNLQFLKNCREFGIEPDWNLLIGFPGEPESVYEKYRVDLPLLTHLSPPHGVYLVRFDRFSPYFNRRHEYGLDLHPMDYYGLTYPFDVDDLASLAYFFADHSIAPYQVESAKHHGVLRDLVARWRGAWSGSTAGPAPRDLRLVGSDGWLIHDSRSGTTHTHRVDDATVWLLRRLSSPTRPDQLAAQWPDDPADLDVRLAWLRDHGMIFVENDRMLSLVLGAHDGGGDQPGVEDEETTAQASRIRSLPLLVSPPVART
ncbi:RiPP maturation radical SAM C-methyltransferase [Plantactinospora sp. B6F1]|uniref:RiPP maturation radical SAM C-methyltransferase n=1 Tax=Plantactinospora sp. B6F1 TaxID=3158971 RepID=UPI0032D8F61A